MRMWARERREASWATSTSRIRLLAAERFSEAVWIWLMTLVRRLPLAPRFAREAETICSARSMELNASWAVVWVERLRLLKAPAVPRDERFTSTVVTEMRSLAATLRMPIWKVRTLPVVLSRALPLYSVASAMRLISVLSASDSFWI